MTASRLDQETAYGTAFFDGQRSGARRSAGAVVPPVVELLRPRSVVDVGCGLGTWLAVLRDHGVEEVLGVDGDYVDRALLEIPGDCFRAVDLTEPFHLDESFDLALSLEVAEHLPAGSSVGFVESLTSLAPVILFSAAVPYQGGTHHVNEQWPEYWASLFREHGYVPLDWLRRQIWARPDVEWWYAQNTLLYAHADYCAARPDLEDIARRTDPSRLTLIHPEAYLKAVGWDERARRAREDLDRMLPGEDSFLWIDQGELTGAVAGLPGALPFLEREGEYWGPPADGTTAVSELGRMRARGASFAVFAWPAFWWLDYYRELGEYLRTRARCVFENDRVIIFFLPESSEADA